MEQDHILTYTTLPECRKDFKYIFVQPEVIKNAESILKKGSSYTCPWDSSELLPDPYCKYQIETQPTLERGWCLQLGSKNKKTLEQLAEKLGLPTQDNYTNSLFFTLLKEYSEKLDWIYVEEKNKIIGAKEILKQEAKIIRTNSSHEIDYFHESCFISTQLSNFDEDKFWSIRVEYRDEKELKALLKILDLPFENGKERVKEINPRKNMQRGSFL